MRRITGLLLFLFALAVPVFMPTFSQTGTTHSITLTWSADPTATGGFNIYRGTVAAGPYTKLTTVMAGVNTYVDTTGATGTEYYYVVTGLDTATPPDESAYSNQASATALGNPLAPSALQAVAK